MPGSDLPKRPDPLDIVDLHIRAARKAEEAGEYAEAADRFLDAAVVAARLGRGDLANSYLREDERCLKVAEQKGQL